MSAQRHSPFEDDGAADDAHDRVQPGVARVLAGEQRDDGEQTRQRIGSHVQHGRSVVVIVILVTRVPVPGVGMTILLVLVLVVMLVLVLLRMVLVLVLMLLSVCSSLGVGAPV